eukprot:m.332487 g.332487  ORF g.332487 m.332487 type:complete len:4620 (+) comp16956_c0_seq1:136-13995(+)
MNTKTENPLIMRVSSLLMLLGLVASSSSFNIGKGGATITKITPYDISWRKVVGSLGGGTKITIEGAGFQRGGIEGGTDVYIGQLRCDIDNYWSSDTKLVCTTRELHWSPLYNLKIKVLIWSHSSASYAKCQAPGNCDFYYHSYATPTVYRSDSAVVPGGRLRFGGRLRGILATQYDIRINGIQCPIRDPYVYVTESGTVVTDTLRRRRDISLDNSQWLGYDLDGIPSMDMYDPESGATDVIERAVLSDWNTDVYQEECEVPSDLEAGYYNYSVHVAAGQWRSNKGEMGYGYARFLETGDHALWKGTRDMARPQDSEAYVLTVFPQVEFDAQSPRVSGSLGGQVVTITGSGFHASSKDCSANKVQLAGIDCPVLTCTSSQLTCRVAAFNSSLVAVRGTTGLISREWSGTNSYNLDDWEDLADYNLPRKIRYPMGGVDGYGPFTRNTLHYAREERRGYFVAPYTANYRFFVHGDRSVAVYLNLNGTSFDNMTKLAYITTRSSNYFTASATQMSDIVALTEGTRYAFLSRHIEDSSDDYYQVGMEILDQPTHPDMFQYQRLNEIQRVQISGSIVFEMQRITISNITSSSRGNFTVSGVVKGQQKTSTYVVEFDEKTSSQASDLRNALRQVFRYSGGNNCNTYTVSVNDQRDTLETLVFDVTIGCRAKVVDGSAVNAGLIQITPAFDEDATSHIVERVIVPSDPISGVFQFAFGAYGTEEVAFLASDSTVESALNYGLPNVAKVDSQRAYWISGGREYLRYNIHFLRPKGINHPMLEIVTSSLYGNDLQVEVTTIVNGSESSRFHSPIPDDFLESAEVESGVTVQVNGIGARCVDGGASCHFEYNSTMTPEVTSVTSSSGGNTVVAGQTLSIMGSGLKPGSSGVQVSFGGSDCSVSIHEDDKIVCTVSHATFGEYLPEVLVLETGLAEIHSSVSKIEYGFSVTSVSPTSGSVRGGTEISLTGTGFSLAEDNDVTVGGLPCIISEVSFESLKCIVPEVNDNGLDSLSHGGNGLVVQTGSVCDSPGDNAEFCLSFGPSPGDSTSIRFTINATFNETISWFALGLKGTGADPSSMAPSDVVMCSVFTDDVIAVDRYNDNVGSSLIDSVDDVSVVNGARTGDTVSCTFDRPLKASDGQDVEVVSGNGNGNVIYAFGSNGLANDTSAYAYYHHQNRGNISGLTFLVPDTLRHRRSSDPYFADIKVGFFNDHIYGTPFTFDWSLTPSILSMTPLAFSGALTTVVNATLDTFAYSPSPVSGCEPKFTFVSPSGVVKECEKLSISGTSVSCIVQRGQPIPAAEQPFMFPRLQLCAVDGSMAVAHPEPSYAEIDIALRITSVSPSEGSLAGSTSVTINGAGFVEMDKKIVRSALSYNYLEDMMKSEIVLADRRIPCEITSSNFNRIVCLTVIPTAVDAVLTSASSHTYSGGYNGAVEVHVNDHKVVGCENDPDAPSEGAISHVYSDNGNFVCEFDYATSATPTVQSISPNSAAGSASVEIVGTGFSSTPVVHIGLDECNVTSYNSTVINADCPAMTAGEYPVSVYIDPLGLAAHPPLSKDAVVFTSLAVFSKIEPKLSSLRGGLVVTLSGEGFSAMNENNKVTIGGKAAHIVHSEHSSIVVITPIGSANASVDIVITADDVEDLYYGQINPVFVASPVNSFSCGDYGGSFELVFRQTLPTLLPKEAWKSLNTSTPDAADYSILSQLESYRNSLGAFEFKMVWPNMTGANTQIWQQTSNPLTEYPKGYVAKSLSFSDNYWGGLQPSSGPTLLDGSNGGSWYYAVGTSANWQDSRGIKGIPGNKYAESVVELYACKEGSETTAVKHTYLIDWSFESSETYLTVELGDKVQWMYNLDITGDHRIISGTPGRPDGKFESPILSKTGSWTFEFTEEGDFPFYSDPYGFMAGKIVVRKNTIQRSSQHRLRSESNCQIAGDCSLEYHISATPTVLAMSPTSGKAGDRLFINGTNFIPLSGETEVLIGSFECAVDVLKEDYLECVIGKTPGGLHTVYVTVGGRGTGSAAEGITDFQATMEVSSISVSHGSFGGGTELVISGHGFSGGEGISRHQRSTDGAWGGWLIYDLASTDAEEDFGVTIGLCNTKCTVTASKYDELTCITNELVSETSLSQFKGTREVSKLEPVSFITSNTGSYASHAERPFDGIFNNPFIARSSSNCYVGIDLGAETQAVVSRFRFFPQHQYAMQTAGGVFEASIDLSNWTTLATVSENPHQSWNWVDSESMNSFRYFRYRGPLGSYCRMEEIEFYGYLTSASDVCNVSVATNAPLTHPSLGPMVSSEEILGAIVSDTTFEFSSAHTGMVISIEPRFGSSLGGEPVTIKGTNLATSTSDGSVKLNGVDCVVQSAAADGSEIVCTTKARGSHRNPISLEVRNKAAGAGMALSNTMTRFRYLDRWSQLNTWLDDQPPLKGDFVSIPEDQAILLDESPPQLLALVVQGVLVFDRQDLNLDATYIFVFGGTLEIGTEEEPFLNKATITLHGDRRKTPELPFIGSKVLAVADKGGFTTFASGKGTEVPLSQKGVIDIHGAPRMRTWTKVAETVEKGTSIIKTAEPVDFDIGETIVLTAPHQELTVAARPDNYTIIVYESIHSRHVSEIVTSTTRLGEETIDMRCEVALLSRNVIIQGAGLARGDGSPSINEEDDEATSEEQLFGMHTGAFHGGHYRIENTELRHCGQAGNLGRYCMHYHVNGDNPAPYSYIKSNSIHHSFQRATTVHSTDHALVQNNVAYHVMGHTYFVEDGDERYNVFDNNIGIFTRPSHLMLKSDTGPATFWTAIPTNYWRHNVATDSEDRGAWFELVDQGITLEFLNNSFHNNKGIGFRNYPNYSPPSPQYFHNNSYFKNGGNGLFYKQGGDNHHVFSKFALNGVDVFWTKYKTHDESRYIPNIQDCTFWGGRGAQAIFAPQNEYFYVSGASFIDYKDDGVLSGCAACCSPNKFKQGAYTVRFDGLEFNGSTKRTKWTCPYKQIMYDLDGSLTGYKGGTALPYYKFNEWDSHCVKDEIGNFTANPNRPGMVCNDKVRVRRLQIYDNEPRELDGKKISFKKSEVIPGNGVITVDEFNRTLSDGKLVDRFGNVDKFGTIDWEKFKKTGLYYEGCEGRPSPGYCVTSAGRDVNSGLNKHPNVTLDQVSCLAWCRQQPGATGCEIIQHVWNKGCYVHTSTSVDHASGHMNHYCWIFQDLRKGEGSLDFSGCDVADGLDWINYRNAGTSSGEFDGWAIPIVTHHDYYADIDWHIDHQYLTTRWSEPFYFEAGINIPMKDEESILLRWPYLDYRYKYRVNYGSANGMEVAWHDSTALSRMDDFGEGLIMRNDNSLRTTGCCGEWKVALNPWSGVDLSLGQNALRMSSEALQCGPNMCGLPGDNSHCHDKNGEWDVTIDDSCEPYRWSQIATWNHIYLQQLNTVDIESTNTFPVSGDSVEIPEGMYVIMDIDPPPLDKLVIVGRLEFEGNRKLDVDRLLVWGELEVGTERKPYLQDAEITLHGVRTSDTLVATDQHFLGNKNFVIFGKVDMHGAGKRSHYELAQTANKGDMDIVVEGNTNSIQPGDKVIISGTEYPDGIAFEELGANAYLEDYLPHQYEEAYVVSVSGVTLTLDRALNYTHLSVSLESLGVTLRAHVGVLTRNVVVRGDLTDAPTNTSFNWYTGYGGHVVVGEVNYGSEEELAALEAAGETLGVTQLLGSLRATNVEFRDMGKLASEHPAIQYRYFSDLAPRDYPENKIESCAFNNGWNYVISTDKSFGIEFKSNVVARSYRTAIDIDLASKGTVLEDNLVIGVHRSPDLYNFECIRDQSCWNAPFAAFLIWNKDFASVKGNIVAGSDDSGFIVYPVDQCESSSKFSNNEAYGTLVGLFLLDVGQNDCRSVSNFKAWKNAHLGVVTVDQSANLELNQVVVADNHIGISLNYVRQGFQSYSKISNSIILGSTEASSCDSSVDCRAVSQKDVRGLTCNSEFGSKFRRVGITMPQYTNKKKTCEGDMKGGVCRPPNKVHRMCSLPWENRFGNLDVLHARLEITSTTFAHWYENDCSRKSRAIALNPSQPDMAPETTLSDLTWSDSDETAKVQLGDASYQTHEAKACGKASCDAVNYFKIFDLDGSTIGGFWAEQDPSMAQEKFTMLSNFNPAQARADKCFAHNNTQSIVCHDYYPSRLVLESQPPRFTKRRLGPVTITKFGESPKYEAADNRTYFSVGPFPQGCSCQKHFAQFHFDVEAGAEYEIYSSGVLQDKNRISYHSENSEDCIVARVFFSKPQNVEVIDMAGNVVENKLNGVLPTIHDEPGTNTVKDRMLYITLCGGAGPKRVFWLNYGKLIIVNMTMALTVDEFFATQHQETRTTGTDAFLANMAALLKIDSSQIKVACVHYVGQPCIPLENRQRRIADSSGSGSGTGDESNPLLQVDVTIEAPQTENRSGTIEATGTEETVQFLTDLVIFMEDIIEDGSFLTAMENAGYKGLSVIIEYEDMLTSSSTTSTSSLSTKSTTKTTSTLTTTIHEVSSTMTTFTSLIGASDSAKSLPTGAVIGSVIAVVVVLAALGILAYVVMRKKETTSETQQIYDGPRQITVVPGNSFKHTKETKFPAEDGESYFSSRSRAEAQKDSLFAPEYFHKVAEGKDVDNYIDVRPEIIGLDAEMPEF